MIDPPTALTLRDWHALRVGLLSIYEGRPALRHHTGASASTMIQAWLIEHGSVRVRTRLAQITAAAGHWLLTTSRKLRHDFSADARILSMKLRVQWPDDRTLFHHDPPVVLVAAEHPRLERAARAMLKLAPVPSPTQPWAPDVHTAPGDLAAYVRYRRRLQRLLEAYVAAMESAGVSMESPAGMDPRVLEVIRAIEHAPAQRPFSQPELARRAGLSESQLHRLFVRQTGRTPFEYYDHQRLEQAEDALRQTDVPIKTIAFTLGFRHPSYFTNWFAKRHGRSPRQFRRADRPGA